jgi:hypothetical protein
MTTNFAISDALWSWVPATGHPVALVRQGPRAGTTATGILPPYLSDYNLLEHL